MDNTVTPTLTNENCAAIVGALWAMYDASSTDRNANRREACLDAIKAVHSVWDYPRN